jgi:hypothetical protein
MGRVRSLILGLVVGFSFASCATPAAFVYKYYGLDAVSYDGTLQGPKPAQDLSLKVCEPIPATPTAPAKPGQCVVMQREEFFRLKGDYLILEKNLAACQHGATAR